MRTLEQHLAVYAAYHRDRWNRLTHYIGVPLLTFALLTALAWLRLPVGGITLTGAQLFVIAVLAWYFLLDVALATAMLIVAVPLLYAADRVAQLSLATGGWVFAATALAGSLFQLIGHVIEGRRPALADNLQQILVAPIFLLAEVFFALGLKREVQRRLAGRASHR